MKSIRELLRHVRGSRSGKAWRIEASPVLGSDLLARLPDELHIMLLEYLCPDDIVAALYASKILRIVWLSEDIWPWMADKWYPDLSHAIRSQVSRRGTIARRPIELNRSTSDQLVGKYMKDSTTQGSQAATPEPSDLFFQMLKRICRRNTGRWRSALHNKMQLLKDPVFSLSKSVPLDQGGIQSTNDLDEDLLESANSHINASRFMVYNNGRIVWWPNAYSAPYIAVVDNLRTARRKMYQFPDHGGVQQGYKTAVSDELLVIARHTMIHAWHFERDVMNSVLTPEELERCIADGSNVLVITKSAELYIWRFEGPLQRITSSSAFCYQPGPVRMGGLVEAPLQSHSPIFHIPRRQGLLLKESGMLLDFILHPCLLDVFFIVTMHEGEVIVHEIDGGKFVKSYRLHTDTKTTAETWNGLNEYLRWEKCDSYGGYCLFSVYLGVDNDLSPSDLQSPEQTFCTCGHTTGLVSVCFNIYTKAFRIECHHLLHSHTLQVDPVPAAFHLWGSKLYASYVPVNMRNTMPITALQCCLAVQERQDDVPDDRVPVYTILERSPGHISRRHRSSLEDFANSLDSSVGHINWQGQVDFGLDITARSASNSVRSHAVVLWNWSAPNVHQMQTLVGDDYFLIYIVDGAYTAWSFANEIPDPKETTKWAPWNRP